MPNDSVKLENLPEELSFAFSKENYNSCYGMKIIFKNLHHEGIGNFFKRWLSFRIKNQITGYDVYFILTIVNDKVVHKLVMAGNPEINKITDEKNPLGPFQKFGDVFGGAAKSFIKP